MPEGSIERVKRGGIGGILLLVPWRRGGYNTDARGCSPVSFRGAVEKGAVENSTENLGKLTRPGL